MNRTRLYTFITFYGALELDSTIAVTSGWQAGSHKNSSQVKEQKSLNIMWLSPDMVLARREKRAKRTQSHSVIPHTDLILCEALWTNLTVQNKR